MLIGLYESQSLLASVWSHKYKVKESHGSQQRRLRDNVDVASDKSEYVTIGSSFIMNWCELIRRNNDRYTHVKVISIWMMRRRWEQALGVPRKCQSASPTQFLLLPTTIYDRLEHRWTDSASWNILDVCFSQYELKAEHEYPVCTLRSRQMLFRFSQISITYSCTYPIHAGI